MCVCGGGGGGGGGGEDSFACTNFVPTPSSLQESFFDIS